MLITPRLSRPNASAAMSMSESAARTFRNACREGRIVAVLWAVNLCWTVGYTYLRGYQHTADAFVVRAGLADVWSPERFTQTAGFPDWILYGVVVPWVVMVTVSILFASLVMADDDLGVEAAEGGHGA